VLLLLLLLLLYSCVSLSLSLSLSLFLFLSLSYSSSPFSLVYSIFSDLKPGDEVAFWTDGDSCIVQGMRSASASEFEGKQGAEVMEGWGKKLDSAVDDSTPLPGDDLDGCDEDEWSD
jgi:hypothetical protein